jgi:peptidoglycan DL-endopeptidase CwlO
MMLRGENFRQVSRKIHTLQFHLISFLKRRFVARKMIVFFREYSATLVVAICVIAVALINLSSSSDVKGSFFGSIVSAPGESNMLKNKIAIQNERKNNLTTAPLADPGYLSDTTIPAEEEYFSAGASDMALDIPTPQSQVMLASYNPITSSGSREFKTYQVKDGDTIGLVAARHGISTNTILWANNLSDTSLIKPGDKLTILPVTGVRYKVQKSDSLEAIVNKYNADKEKVLAYNQLPADEKLKAGQDLIIPDGYIAPPNAAPSASGTQLASAGRVSTSGTTQYASVTRSYASSDSRAGSGHRFPYGYCTWYVAQRKYVPWGGNAGSWLANARASGKATGRTPQPGAIVVTGESRWGHVAVVESVKGNSFTISEMNYAGFGKKSTRTLSATSRVVRGFIY